VWGGIILKSKYWMMLICFVVVGASLGGYTLGSHQARHEANLTSPRPIPPLDNKSSSTPSLVQPNSNLQDRDTLLQLMALVHDSGEGFEYTEAQLIVLQANPENKDYRKVLHKFVQSRLSKEIDTFQTIGKPVNPRTLLITTKDHFAYMVYMRKDYSHDGIWLVSGFLDYMPQGNEVPETYKMVSLTQAPNDVMEWAQALLKLPEWKKEYRTFGGRTYALIKSSVSTSDSVELENVTAFAGEVHISYQTYQHETTQSKELSNDYLLLELLAPSIREVHFQNTYSNIP
jgi:hypothetical protein